MSPRTLIPAIAAAALAAAPTLAADPIVISSTADGVRVAEVTSDGYDLANAEQRSLFTQRLKRVSGKVCSEPTRDIKSLQKEAACEASAFEGAVAQIDRMSRDMLALGVTVSVTGN